jgi:hypothetical protein
MGLLITGFFDLREFLQGMLPEIRQWKTRCFYRYDKKGAVMD